MASVATLAQPYGKALFELARDGASLAKWSTMLASVAQVLEDASVQRLIGHPAVSREKLGALVIEVLGESLSPAACNYVKVLAENGRFAAARAIANEFERLRAEHESRVDVEIATAAPVEAAQKSALQAAVKARLEREISVNWTTEPELIGGAVIRAGDLVIDASVRGGLEKMGQALAA